MKVSRWGKRLAIRLPVDLVSALDQKGGDQVEVKVVRSRESEICDDQQASAAIETLRALRRPLPANFRFDRDAAHER